MIDNKKHYLKLLFYLITIFVLVFDLLTKALTDGIVFQEAIKGVFAIESFHNTGASFSIFAGSKAAQIVFIVLGICVSIGIVIYSILTKSHNLNWCFFVGASLMVGGIVGNIIDRIAFGYVRDFISFSIFEPVFNIADSFIVIGVICTIKLV